MVESQEIGSIEAGEAMLNDLDRALQFTGIDEAELTTGTSATFKNAFARVAPVLLVWFDPLCDSTIEKKAGQ